MHGDSCDAFRKGCVACEVEEGLYNLRDEVLASRPLGGRIDSHRLECEAVRHSLTTSLIMDLVRIFTLVSFVESLVHSGIADPYEFYRYVDVGGHITGDAFGIIPHWQRARCRQKGVHVGNVIRRCGL